MRAGDFGLGWGVPGHELLDFSGSMASVKTFRVEEREVRGLTCVLLDGSRDLEVVEVRRGQA
jgi:hypothetical protein